MADLIIDNPKTPEAFVAALVALNVKLPLKFCETELGVLIDDDGRDVITLDVNRERPDDEVAAIAAYLVMAINAAGGLRAAAAVIHDATFPEVKNGR